MLSIRLMVTSVFRSRVCWSLRVRPLALSLVLSPCCVSPSSATGAHRYHCVATSLSVVGSFDVHTLGRILSPAIPPSPNLSMLLIMILHFTAYHMTKQRTDSYVELRVSLPSSSDRSFRVAIFAIAPPSYTFI
ncbi:hypothetical protein EDC04DRAFT_142624 [Pisolithus marmoratus]|nr:hypothetical protein EDC04DRAFT_142624 [Pisolithus marmoratus]